MEGRKKIKKNIFKVFFQLLASFQNVAASIVAPNNGTKIIAYLWRRLITPEKNTFYT
jgi:hypothetical protein